MKGHAQHFIYRLYFIYARKIYATVEVHPYECTIYVRK